MILRFMEWCDEQGPLGGIVFILLGTFMCCTGLAIPVLICDMLNDRDD